MHNSNTQVIKLLITIIHQYIAYSVNIMHYVKEDFQYSFIAVGVFRATHILKNQYNYNNINVYIVGSILKHVKSMLKKRLSSRFYYNVLYAVKKNMDKLNLYMYFQTQYSNEFKVKSRRLSICTLNMYEIKNS